jgi:predicted ATPase
LEALKAFWSGVSSLEALSPALLRSVSSRATAIGVDGENLAGFVAALSAEQQQELTRLIRTFYPELTGVVSAETHPGVHHLFMNEDDLGYYATHAPDGVLRILAILAQTLVPKRLLVFDEIENGIHPALIARLVKVLQGLGSQVIVTTHSPLVLNYLADEVAREALVLLYRDQASRTRAVRFFDLPGPAEALTVLGPGEVYADTMLRDLTAHLAKGA